MNYQSISGAKGLLEFANGGAITADNKGAFWLAVHGANMWGEDKVSLEDREKWVHDNEDWILDCGRYPISNHFNWLLNGKPSGQNIFNNLNNNDFHKHYEKLLDSIDQTDTLIGYFSKKN